MKFLTQVNALSDFRLHLTFADGACGVVRIDPWQRGPVFAPLKDPQVFAAAFIDEYGALAWPGDIDFDPDALYELLQPSGPIKVG